MTNGDNPIAEGAISSDEEMAHYGSVASSETKFADLVAKVERVRGVGDWASDLSVWLDAPYDAASQADVYAHLAPVVVAGRVVQMGGTGQAALKALMGGATSAVLVTPAEGEAELATRVAGALGVGDKFEARVGFGEDMPVDDGWATAVISEACLHHTNVPVALADAARVLGPGGRFGAWDPWKAPMYEFGIRVFGKRDKEVDCRPLDPQRMAGADAAFPGVRLSMHGAFSRYPSIVLGRVKAPSVERMLKRTAVDDRLAARFGALERHGSSCAVLALKP